MVVARGFNRWEHIKDTQCFLTRAIDVEIFQTPAHLLARNHFAFAIFALRVTDCFDHHHASVNAASPIAVEKDIFLSIFIQISKIVFKFFHK